VLRIALALLLICASFGLTASAASADCAFCVDNVSLQTRDGQPWANGAPVTLVVRFTSHAIGVAAPQGAVAVVMQTDGDRTKCLDIPMKLVSFDGTNGIYAGLFFPFRAARYDGKLSIGNDVSDVQFNVEDRAPGAAPAGDLPAAERIDTSATPISFVPGAQLPALAGAAVAFWAIIALVVSSYRRRATTVQAG
jgi:hypothetical protein